MPGSGSLPARRKPHPLEAKIAVPKTPHRVTNLMAPLDNDVEAPLDNDVDQLAGHYDHLANRRGADEFPHVGVGERRFARGAIVRVGSN
jgi:hypothetical protein